MRPIDADKLIADLEHDIAIDEDILNYVGTVGAERTNTQFDKDCKQNAIYLLMTAPTIEVPTWIPFEIRPTDDDEREYFKSETILVGAPPDEGDEILVSRGKWVWQDTFVSDELGAWLDGYGEIEDGMAWMPLPKSYEETDQ